MLVAGLLILISTVLVYAWPKTRSVDRELPDHSALEVAPVAEG